MAAVRLRPVVAAATLLVLGTAGCGGRAEPRPAGARTAAAAAQAIPPALARESRPIGHGAAFAPPAQGPVLGACRPALGRRAGVHVEVFAADRVVLVAAGIGVRGPIQRLEGRITGARCFGELVTLEPTGVVLLAPGTHATVGDLFQSWGRPLGARRLLSFTGRVRVYVAGHRVPGPAGRVALTPHAEVVLEVGPYVPPHAGYHFPPGA